MTKAEISNRAATRSSIVVGLVQQGVKQKDIANFFGVSSGRVGSLKEFGLLLRNNRENQYQHHPLSMFEALGLKKICESLNGKS